MSNSDRRRSIKSSPIEAVAGNGLLDRRALLGRGVVFAGAMSTGAFGSVTGAAAEPSTEAPWSLEPGTTIKVYELPSRFEKDVVRTLNNPDGQPGAQGARTPHRDPTLFVERRDRFGARRFSAARPNRRDWDIAVDHADRRFDHRATVVALSRYNTDLSWS